MPGQKQRESFVLKHRLAGAGVLIGFAVIVLPILLGGPDQAESGLESGAARSDSDTKVFRSNITPIGGTTPDVQSRNEGAGQTVAELLESSKSQSEIRGEIRGETRDGAGAKPESAPAAAGVEETRAEPVAESAGTSGDAESQVAARGESASEDGKPEKKTEAAKKIERGWIVQVGTFKNASNVEKLVTQLESKGFGSSTTEVEVAGASATRVWVGPFATRVEAARIKTRVKQSTGSEGLIVAYP